MKTNYLKKSYYIEIVASRSSGLTFQLNAKMFKTDLDDKCSSNVHNDIQEIEISSEIINESFNIYHKSTVNIQGVSEVQQLTLLNSSNYQAPFILDFDGVDTSFFIFYIYTFF